MVVAFTPRLTAPSSTNPWYIHTSAGGKNSCIKISGNSVLPNCVGYAWGRFGEIMGSTPKLSRGNAGTWYGNTSDGYARGKTPRLGAVACWSKPGAAGHVAIVEKINADGSIVISESGYRSSSKFWTSTRSGPNWYSSPYKFQGFIYNPSVNSGGLADGVDASNIIDDFVHLAESHVGEGGSWAYRVSGLAPGNAWCCAFVDACAKTLNLCKVLFPHTYACRYMVRDGVADYNCTYTKGAHFGNKNIIPARGDLILFRWKTYTGKQWWFAEHIGIVRKVENGKVYTVEGNSSNKVRLKDYDINYKCIAGYLRADWAKVGGYVSGGYLGPLYETRNTREDAIIREVGYINSNYEPSIHSSDIELSVINYTSLLSDLFDNFREKYGYMFAGGDVDVNVDGVSGNCKIVIEFFLKKGFNAAAAVGVAANIKQESNFNTAAVGDNGTSFGICQWHAGRGANMKNFVGSDWRTDLTGQLNFLLHELETSYKSVLSAMKSASNTLEGAKHVADVFVRKFEIPANVNQRSKERQAIAETYWKQIVIQQTPSTVNSSNKSSVSTSSGTGTGKLLGRFKLTAYCNCSKCCGKWAGGPTASGVMPKAGRTIAVDPKVIPLGSKVKINGHTYVAEDTGGAIKGNRIDVYHSSHSAALDFGVHHADVYLLS